MPLDPHTKFIKNITQGSSVSSILTINFLPSSEPAKLARTALLKEVYLTPKPGLVDRRNAGSHHDMDFYTFLRSINAISKWFDYFYQLGCLYPEIVGTEFLKSIRPIGIGCEQVMFKDTQGINTHKGGIFAFGLLSGALGRLETRREHLCSDSICQEVAYICADIVGELDPNNPAKTVGEKLFQQYGITGARGEAAAGYTTVRQYGLPIYLQLIREGVTEELALLQTLLNLLAHNDDTNVISRGGLDGLKLVQAQANYLLEQGGIFANNGIEQMIHFDDLLINHHLSPGGSADLLGVTWFLAQYDLMGGY